MAVTVIDTFTGTNGAAVSSAIWTTSAQGTGTALINTNKGRLTADLNFQKAAIESKASFTRGEFTGSITAVSGVDLLAFGAFGAMPYAAPYSLYPVNGYAVKVTNSTGQLDLLKVVAEVPTVLATVAGIAVPLGTAVRFAIRAKTTGVDAWVWRDAAARPGPATLTALDTTYSAGIVRPCLQSGATAGVADVDDVTWDDLAAGAGAANGSARIGGVLVPTLTRTRLGGVLV